jgi:cellobiose phosphorylase
MGYTIIGSRYQGIRAETLYFVPLGEDLEIWRIRVTNDRDEAAKISLFGSVEWCLWDANDDATNFQRNYSIGQVEVEDGVIYHKSEYRERRDHFAFFACSEPAAGFDTSAMPSWGHTAAGIGRSWSSRVEPRTRLPTAGSRWARTTSDWTSSPARPAR